MDRLVCGDVGFGCATEVAIRAAYRVAMAGKQVALLCPTTVLAQQHYLGLPGTPQRLSRARPVDEPVSVVHKDQEETLAKLKDGSCDIVIGTHRLLSKDVHFKDLGLLVVDEGSASAWSTRTCGSSSSRPRSTSSPSRRRRSPAPRRWPSEASATCRSSTPRPWTEGPSGPS